MHGISGLIFVIYVVGIFVIVGIAEHRSKPGKMPDSVWPLAILWPLLPIWALYYGPLGAILWLVGRVRRRR